MPEGPSLVLLREEAERFVGKIVREVGGNSTADVQRMRRRKVLGMRTWGKHFLLEFSGFALRVHMLLFGSYRVNERRDRPPRLSLAFANGELNFYASDVRFIEGDLDAVYDWSGDVMSEAWSPRAARRKLLARPDRLVCDVLLDQDVFAGVGNIIRNEVLHRIRVHPESPVGALPSRTLGALIREARAYSFDFLEWKRANELRRHWQVHKRSTCARCGTPVTKTYPGTSKRRAFHCLVCQRRYGPALKAARRATRR